MFDKAASRHQQEFRRAQGWILSLGLLATGLALVQSELEARALVDTGWPGRLLRYVIVLVPISLTVLVAATGRFKPGNKWVLLRGSAESLKREIYKYRTRAAPYSDAHPGTTAGQVLASEVGKIGTTAMQTELNLTALQPHDGPLPPPRAIHPGDDGFSRLSPERYLEVRLKDQLDWYRRKSLSLERRRRWLRLLIVAIGGVGTFLAAIGLELWVALTTAVAAAAVTYLEYEQVESTLLHYNQAAAGLETVRGWWVGLPVDAQLDQANVDRLVEHAEQVMRTEQSGWVQQMQDALAELRVQQEQPTRDEKGGAPSNH